MKKALISPIELRYDSNGNQGYRIAAVSVTEFPVAKPLYWMSCPEECIQDRWILVGGHFIDVPPVAVVHVIVEPDEPVDVVQVI